MWKVTAGNRAHLNNEQKTPRWTQAGVCLCLAEREIQVYVLWILNVNVESWRYLIAPLIVWCCRYGYMFCLANHDVGMVLEAAPSNYRWGTLHTRYNYITASSLQHFFAPFFLFIARNLRILTFVAVMVAVAYRKNHLPSQRGWEIYLAEALKTPVGVEFFFFLQNTWCKGQTGGKTSY